MTASPPPGYLARTLGEQLVAVRGDTSQRAQAKAAGMAGNTLRELEKGLANPTLARVEQVADALGLRVEVKVTKARK